MVSTTPDFQSGIVCGQLSDHTQTPEVSQCGGAAQGRYITVDLVGGGTSGGVVVTICEIAVWGTVGNGMVQDSNLALNARGSSDSDPCRFDPCVADGSCAVETNNVNGGGQAGTNGIRICGDTRSSTVGWGGEPDRAIDGNTDGNWGGGSCTHTDTAPAWWQIDLGVVAHITHVDVWHRTNCCQDRLESANIIVSTTDDFKGADARTCDPLSDHTQEPEVSQCHGLEGRYVTVDHESGGGGKEQKQLITELD